MLTTLQKQGAIYLCQCACGTIKTYRGAHIRSGNSKSCGCNKGKAIKLTAAKVIEIRKLHSQGKSMYGLAQRFEVSNSTLRAIVLNKIWRWV